MEPFRSKLMAFLALKWVAAGMDRRKAITAPEQIVSSIKIAALLTQLLVKLLAARKRPRDWKQEDYSSRVCSTLTAVSDVFQLRVFSKGVVESTVGKAVKVAQLDKAYGPLGRVEVLCLTAAAQEEVGQLLQAALKQPQQQGHQAAQQQQGYQSAQHKHQQPGQQPEPQLPPLCRLAGYLLALWTCIDLPWLANDVFTTGAQIAALARQKPALQLAALLAQHPAALLHDSSSGMFHVLARVAGR
jgi:hypothetical protein